MLLLMLLLLLLLLLLLALLPPPLLPPLLLLLLLPPPLLLLLLLAPEAESGLHMRECQWPPSTHQRHNAAAAAIPLRRATRCMRERV